MIFTDRVPPHSKEAERAILGALLTAPNRVVVDAALTADAFYVPAHAQIYAAICDMMAANGRRCDVVLLADWLQDRNLLEQCGGLVYLVECLEECQDWFNAEYYSRQVVEMAGRRAVLATLAESHTALMNTGGQREVSEICTDLSASFDGILQSTVSDAGVSIQEAVDSTMLALASPRQTVSTGYIDLDRVLNGGMSPGQLVVVAARPGGGKSALATCMVTKQSEQQTKTAFVSLEMSSQEIMCRKLSALSGVGLSRIITRDLSSEEQIRIEDAAVKCSQLKGRIFTNLFDASKILAAARQLKLRAELDVLFIDYLQIVDFDRSESRYVQIGEFTKALKKMAQQMGIVVVLLAQLGREVEKRGSKPRLSDLRESGNIEQDADIVLFVHHEESDEGEKSSQLIIAKHRNGQTGFVEIDWRPEIVRFANSAKYQNYGGAPAIAGGTTADEMGGDFGF